MQPLLTHLPLLACEFEALLGVLTQDSAPGTCRQEPVAVAVPVPRPACDRACDIVFVLLPATHFQATDCSFARAWLLVTSPFGLGHPGEIVEALTSALGRPLGVTACARGAHGEAEDDVRGVPDVFVGVRIVPILPCLSLPVRLLSLSAEAVEAAAQAAFNLPCPAPLA